MSIPETHDTPEAGITSRPSNSKNALRRICKSPLERNLRLINKHPEILQYFRQCSLCGSTYEIDLRMEFDSNDGIFYCSTEHRLIAEREGIEPCKGIIRPDLIGL